RGKVAYGEIEISLVKVNCSTSVIRVRSLRILFDRLGKIRQRRSIVPLCVKCDAPIQVSVRVLRGPRYGLCKITDRPIIFEVFAIDITPVEVGRGTVRITR